MLKLDLSCMWIQWLKFKGEKLKLTGSTLALKGRIDNR